MSNARRITEKVVALNGGDPDAPIHRDALRVLTACVYARTGANGAIFGFARPWMVKVGEFRYLTEHGRRRLGF